MLNQEDCLENRKSAGISAKVSLKLSLFSIKFP